jgi:S1-C subfamily serine protease
MDSTHTVVRLPVNRAANRHAGIVLYDDVTRGVVRVLSIVPTDEAARCGMAKKDVILDVNGIPAVHHRDVITVVQACTDGGYPVTFHVAAPSHVHAVGSKWRREARMNALKFHEIRDAWRFSHPAS